MNCAVVAGMLSLIAASSQAAVLEGLVRDANDRPVVGARVGIATAAPLVGQGMFCPSCYLDCAKSVRTNDDGNFQFDNVSDSLKFQVLVTAPGYKSHVTKYIAPANGKLDLHLDAAAKGDADRTILGRVVDDAGKPIEGVLIEPNGAKTKTRRWGGAVSNVAPTVSDMEGRFNFLLPDDMLALDLVLTINGKAGLAKFLIEPKPDEASFAIPNGTSVTGRLIYQGKPVAGLGIAVVQLERGAFEHLFIKAVTTATDDAGRFEFHHLPASERYAIFTMVGEGASPKREFVLTTKLFTAKGDSESRDLGDLQLVPSVHIRGRFELPAGVRLPAGTKLSLDRDPAWDLVAMPVEPDGTFVIDGLPPETYELELKAKGLEVDNSRVTVQVRGPLAVGLRVDKSIDEISIPMVAR